MAGWLGVWQLEMGTVIWCEYFDYGSKARSQSQQFKRCDSCGLRYALFTAFLFFLLFCHSQLHCLSSTLVAVPLTETLSKTRTHTHTHIHVSIFLLAFIYYCWALALIFRSSFFSPIFFFYVSFCSFSLELSFIRFAFKFVGVFVSYHH